MKFTQAKITKIVQSVIRGNKHYGEHIMMHPVREWYCGVFFCVILVSGGAYFATTVFMRHQVVSLYESATVASSSVYRESVVDSALVELAKKQSRYAELEQRLIESKPLPGNTTKTVATTTADGRMGDVPMTPVEVKATSSVPAAVSPETPALAPDEIVSTSSEKVEIAL